MARKWNGNIEDLPSDVLSLSIQAILRSDLRDIGARLSARDSGHVDSWESLAERLGFCKDDVDRVLVEARTQDCCPGFLALREWAGRPGSTAYVLLHALREIGREDVLQVLVERLTDLNTMLLFVCVEDRVGVRQFLRVRTLRNAPLHASLDNELPSLYWYDITGPRPGLDWCTPSGQLQGAQLTLKRRDEPCEESRNQIYYGLKTPGCKPPAGSPPRCPSPCTSPRGSPVAGNPQPPTTQRARQGNPLSTTTTKHVKHVNRVEMNFPPVQPRVSVTVDLLDPNRLNVKAEGPNIRLVNDLSGNRMSPVQHTENAVHQSCDNIRTSPNAPDVQKGLVPRRVQLPCKPGSATDGFEPKAVNSSGSPSPFQLSLLTGFSSFSSLSTSPLGGEDLELPATSLPPNVLSVQSDTFIKQCCPSSLTDLKQPRACPRGACEEEDNDAQKLKAAAAFGCRGSRPGAEDEEEVRGLGQQSSSSSFTSCCLHPEYVLAGSLNQCDIRDHSVTQTCSQKKKESKTPRTACAGKNTAVSAGHSHTQGHQGKPTPFSNGCPALSTLHPEYILPDTVKQIGDSGGVKQICDYPQTHVNTGERPVTQYSIQVHSSGGRTPESANITVVNSYGRESRPEAVPDHAHHARCGGRDKTRPAACVVKPPQACACPCSVAGFSGSQQCPGRSVQSGAGFSGPPQCPGRSVQSGAGFSGPPQCSGRSVQSGAGFSGPPQCSGRSVQSGAGFSGPPQCSGRSVQSGASLAVGRASPVACLVSEASSSRSSFHSAASCLGQGLSCGNTAHSAAEVFSAVSSAAGFAVRQLDGANQALSSRAGHVLLHTGGVTTHLHHTGGTSLSQVTHVNQTYITACSAQACPSYANPTSSSFSKPAPPHRGPTNPKPTLCPGPGDHVKYLSPVSPRQSSPRESADNNKSGRVSPRPCQISAHPHQSTSAPILDDDDDKEEETIQTNSFLAGQQQQQQKKNSSSSSRSREKKPNSPPRVAGNSHPTYPCSVPSATRKDRGWKPKPKPKPKPCSYTNSISPHFCPRLHNEGTELHSNNQPPDSSTTSSSTSSSSTSSIFLTLSPNHAFASTEAPSSRTNPPRERAAAVVSPPSHHARKSSTPSQTNTEASALAGEGVFSDGHAVEMSQSSEDASVEDEYMYLRATATLGDGSAGTPSVPGWNPNITEETPSP
ncbi:uncharacterized protein LOC143299814 isoform X2 [Babylonia areolata]|uniref:uncharacterized protein LOC143299814 isoform X2 n=1 Tax=Babylonia areolata TaxID=304850 RepID=UPI003FCF9B8A